jgi:hypothetical protein
MVSSYSILLTPYSLRDLCLACISTGWQKVAQSKLEK